MKKYLSSLFFLICVCQFFSATRSDAQIVKYLNNDWLVFDEASKKFYPFVTGNKNDLPLHINLEAKNYLGLYLNIRTKQPIALYVNHQFWDEVSSQKDTSISIDSISKGATPVILSFYGQYNQSLIDSIAILSSTQRFQHQDDGLRSGVPLLRVSNIVRDYFAILLILCFALFVLVRNTYTKIFDQYTSLLSILSDNSAEHSSSRVTFDGYNFAFIIVGVFFFSIVCASFPIFQEQSQNLSFFEFFGKVFYLVFLSAFFYLLKYVATYAISWLFSVNKFAISHFMIFVRVSVLWSVVLLLLTMLNYAEVVWIRPIILPIFLFSSLFFLTLTSIKVSFLINRVTKVSTLYLISYLCITEWLPYFVIVKLYTVYFY